MHIVEPAIPALRKALKGVALQRLVAIPAWVCHRVFLRRILVTNIISSPRAYRPETTQDEGDRGNRRSRLRVVWRVVRGLQHTL
jgi:hypothetical protein